jgi:hypothetical protein
LHFERQNLKLGFHFISARVETTWYQAPFSCGSGGINVHRPTTMNSSVRMHLSVAKPRVRSLMSFMDFFMLK